MLLSSTSGDPPVCCRRSIETTTPLMVAPAGMLKEKFVHLRYCVTIGSMASAIARTLSEALALDGFDHAARVKSPLANVPPLFGPCDATARPHHLRMKRVAYKGTKNPARPTTSRPRLLKRENIVGWSARRPRRLLFRHDPVVHPEQCRQSGVQFLDGFHFLIIQRLLIHYDQPAQVDRR